MSDRTVRLNPAVPRSFPGTLVGSLAATCLVTALAIGFGIPPAVTVTLGCGVALAFTAFVARKTQALNLRVQELEVRNGEMSRLIDSVTDSLSRHAPDGTYLYVSPACEKTLGLSADELLGHTPYEFVHPDDLPTMAAANVDLVRGQESLTLTFRHRDRTGNYRWLETHCVTTFTEDGQPFEIQAVTRDISRRREREAQIEAQKHFAEELARCSPNLLYIYDLQKSAHVYENRSFAETLGYAPGDPDAPANTYAPTIIHPDDMDALAVRIGEFAELPDGGITQSEFRVRRADGTYAWIHVRETVFARHPNGRPSQILGVVIDVTDRKVFDEEVEGQMLMIQDNTLLLEIQRNLLEEANEKLERLATCDGLTGIANHRAFQESLAKRYAEHRRDNRPVSMILLDVDHFKQYNDSFGHPAGDVVLKSVATLLAGSVRETDLAARYGGEEFAVILPGTGLDIAQRVAEKIRAAIAGAEWPNREVTASIGVASTELGLDNPGELIHAADEALYAAKRGGRNQVCVAPPHAAAA